MFEQVAEHIRREPVQSTRLLEAWIGSTEEMEDDGARTGRNAQAVQKVPLMLPEASGLSRWRSQGLRKAAILMVALGDDLAKTLFQSLSESDVHRVTEEITRLGEIRAQHLTQVLTEFYACSRPAVYGARRTGVCSARADRSLWSDEGRGSAAQVRRIRDRANGDMAALQRWTRSN